MAENTISHFVVLFTAQKTKKFKTWQDGTMKYYSSNKKLVLTDEKGYNIDRKFYKGGIPDVGDELEFDGHIVTIESFECTESAGTAQSVPPPQPSQPQRTTCTPIPNTMPSTPNSSMPTMTRTIQVQKPTHTVPQTISHPQPPVQIMEQNIEERASHPAAQFKAPVAPKMIPKKRLVDMSLNDDDEDDGMEIDPVPVTPKPHQQQIPPPQEFEQEQQFVPISQQKQPVVSTSYHTTPQKRVRVGLSKRTTSTLHQSTHREALSTENTASNVSTTTAIPKVSQMNTTHKQAVSRSTSNTDNSHAASSSSSSNSSFTPASRIPPTTTSDDANGPSLTSNEIVKPFKSPFAEGNTVSMVLQFPNAKKALTVLKTKKYPKRSKVVPTKFANVNLYKETFKKVIHEHVEILLLNYALYFYTMYEKFSKGKRGPELERIIRSKGLGMYVECELKGDQRFEKRLRIMVNKSREHYSKYNKDDIWVISKVPTFESSQTFLARSTYYGPFSDGALELDCVTPRDVRVASKLLDEHKPVYALRTISASTEFMMLDTLDQHVDSLPLLPYILTDGVQKKKKNQIAPPQPLPTMEHIKLRWDDNIDVETKFQEMCIMYRLNEDQQSVLRRVARSVIVCPGWNEQPEHPIVLVHGVYGSGKSFLAAVIIIFIQEIVDAVNDKREPEDKISFKILVSSMTNVAVDRILQTLLKLGYDHFIRIGSMKKIAKNLLPYTSKARLNSNEELKELEQMLEDPHNSEEDNDNISTAIQRFRKSEGASHVQSVSVVGTTFMSSGFEVFNGIKFPFVLVDESSQLMEPLTMVPLARFFCNRLVMIGDPLQLPPTLATNAEEGKLGMGLDKTIFDRMVEMGHESVMLRTQYRCHPDISNISNKLFYDRRLLNGVTVEDRKPLIEGLPTLLFVDVGGTENKSMRSNSYWNETEVAISAYFIQTMIRLDVSPSDLGVISLYKEQADKLSECLSSGSTDSSSSKSVQISTVDAFQGGEKEVIILSTVRTTESQFMDNQPRINVALTRAKRHLIILGNRNLFTMNDLWSRVLWECQSSCMNRASFAKLLSDLQINQT